MPDIKQPELPAALSAYQIAAQLNVYSTDQMHAHYAKGREAERAECDEVISHYKKCWLESANAEQILSGLLLKAEAELATLKQSLAQPDIVIHEAHVNDIDLATGEQQSYSIIQPAQQLAQPAVPEAVLVALNEVRADAGYLFGRVAADGSFAGAAEIVVKSKLQVVADWLNAAPEREGGV